MPKPPPDELKEEIQSLCSYPEGIWHYLGCIDGEVFIVYHGELNINRTITSRTVHKPWGFRGRFTPEMLPSEIFAEYAAWVLEQ